MAALTADKMTPPKGRPRQQSYPVAAATIIYAGAMVVINANGYAEPATDAANKSDVVGIAPAKVDNSGGANGDVKVLVEYGTAFLITVGASITQADVGRTAVVSDDQTAIDAGAGAQDVYIGPVREYVAGSPNKAWIHVVGGR